MDIALGVFEERSLCLLHDSLVLFLYGEVREGNQAAGVDFLQRNQFVLRESGLVALTFRNDALSNNLIKVFSLLRSETVVDALSSALELLDLDTLDDSSPSLEFTILELLLHQLFKNVKFFNGSFLEESLSSEKFFVNESVNIGFINSR